MSLTEKRNGNWLHRFWSKVQKTKHCWNWSGAVAGYGYGVLKVGILHHNRRQHYAHRLSFLIHRGEIPTGMLVCHKCDNPKCVNPRHLFLGTQKQNMADARKKGRVEFGERRYNARLTDNGVRTIKRLVADGATYRDVALRFGVSEETAWKAATRRTWRHVK